MQKLITRLITIGERWLLVEGWRRTLVIAATAACYAAFYAVALFKGGVAPVFAIFNFFLIVISATTLRIPGGLAASTLSAVLVGPLVRDYVALPGYVDQFHWTVRFIIVELFGLFSGGVSEVIRHQAQSLRSTTERFMRAQKMEAVGQLASGIAHDFNNVLTVIIGFGEMAQSQVGSDHPASGSVGKMLDAARRGASLSHQILAYSRRGVLDPTTADLNEAIEELRGILERIAGEKISLTASLDPGLKPVKIGYSQLEQVIMNLAVNARDAIEGVGTIKFTTKNTELSPSHPDFRSEMAPGPYVLLSIADTGAGMSPEVAARVFEPYFTTKPRGTGLGLSTVYGIIKQSGGYLYVESQQGSGTIFNVFLPVAAAPKRRRRPVREQRAPIRHGRGRILFVEDEEEVCLLMRDALVLHGYEVFVARDAREAQEIFKKSEERIDLLIADIGLPDRDGFELRRQLVALDPALRSLLVTGYDRNHLPPSERGLPLPILEKPYGVNDLLSHVSRILEAERA